MRREEAEKDNKIDRNSFLLINGIGKRNNSQESNFEQLGLA